MCVPVRRRRKRSPESRDEVEGEKPRVVNQPQRIDDSNGETKNDRTTQTRTKLESTKKLTDLFPFSNPLFTYTK